MQIDLAVLDLENRIEADIRIGVGKSAADKVGVDRQVGPPPGLQFFRQAY
jgi:hypothetical protein